ncbi:MAG TPA: glycosyltransferase family 4 protein [Vicinamibacterales bacterium]|nr:glycosyltransferase family 4 protein [Vicinamibacterales bacterium]
MRICFFNRSYWPDQAATGQLLTELAQDLVRDYGCSVSVVAGPALHGRERSNVSWWPVTRENHNGVRILRANGTRLPRRKFIGRAANYLTYFASAYAAALQIGAQDVVVSLTDPPILGLAALSAARRVGARFVFLCEDIFPEVASLLEDFHNATVNRTLDRINRRLVREADAVVALGDRMKQRLVEEKGAPSAGVRVIHNWADCQAIAPGPKDNAFARTHGLHDKFVLMHSGNVGLSQNLDLLIEAAARLQSRERLVIAIVGDGARRGPLEEMARQRGLTNVRFFPYQPKELLHESFATADAFVVSLKPGLEGYIVPSKLYGILAAGRPFVAAVDPSCEAAALATKHSCGVVAPPGDPDALVAAIARLYDDPAGARRMGENARQASWSYDRRVAVRAYHTLFASLGRLAPASTAA